MWTWLSTVTSRSAFRFLVAGAINTASTVALYVVLLAFVSHALAYSVAFAAGVVISYLLNRTFVFRSRGGFDTVLLFPLVYLVQYLVGLGVVLVWVDVLHLPASVASLVAVVVTIPLTYVLARWVFLRRTDVPPDQP